MRTIPNLDDAILRTQARSDWARVWIADDTGALVSYDGGKVNGAVQPPFFIPGLRGENWLVSAQWGENVDTPVMDAIVTLRRQAFDFKLSPLFATGALSDSLDIGREIVIEAAVVPMGTKPPEDLGAFGWREMFRGNIDSWRIAGDNIELRCRETIGRTLQDAFIELEREYGVASPGTPIETVIQSILDDNGLSFIVLDVPVSPGFGILPYEQRRESVLSALETLVGLIGWEVRSVYDEGSGTWKLRLFEPDRAVTTTARDFNEALISQFGGIQLDLQRVRNVVQIWYSDSGDLDNNGVPKRKSVEASDTASIDKFGRRWMEIAEASTAQLDSLSEASALANALLADLATPTALQTNTLPFFWPVELRDYYTFKAGEFYDTDLDLAVRAYRHELRQDGGFWTLLNLAGKPVARFVSHLDREVKPGSAQPKRESGPVDVKAFSVNVDALSAELDLPRSDDFLWDGYEVHRSTSAAFTPDATTLIGYARANKFVDTRVAIEIPYYYKAFPVASQGQRGPVSAEVSALVEGVNREHLHANIRKAFRIRQAVDQTMSASAEKLNFGTYIYGSDAAGDGGFDTSTDSFTAPADGLYAVLLAVTEGDSNANVDTFQAALSRVGAGIFETGPEMDSDPASRRVSTLVTWINLDSGDEIQPFVVTTGSSSLFATIGNDTIFAVTPVPADNKRT